MRDEVQRDGYFEGWTDESNRGYPLGMHCYSYYADDILIYGSTVADFFGCCLERDCKNDTIIAGGGNDTQLSQHKLGNNPLIYLLWLAIQLLTLLFMVSVSSVP